MKKLLAILLAVVMMLALATTAFAVQDVNANSGEGSITIANAVKDKVYDIYRMFDLKLADNNNDGTFESYSYTVNPDWADFFFAADAAGADYLVKKTEDNAADYAGYNELVYNDEVYFMNITDANVAALATDALPYATALANSDGTQTASADGALTFADIALGYYLVFPQGATQISDDYASICSLDTTDTDVTVQRKAEYPTVDKTVDDQDVEVGQIVNWTVTGKVPDTTGYETYTYKLTDTMSEGLTFNADVANMVVKFGDEEITVPEEGKNSLTFADNGFVLNFDMTQYQDYKEQTITVTYQSVVNEDAICVVTENELTLTYTNDPDGGEDNTPPIKIPVYTSEIIVDKFDGADKSVKLAGAKFVLVKKDAEGNESYYKFTAATETDDAKVSWYTLAEGETVATAAAAGKLTEVVTDENGAADFKGLAEGTYYLRETAAPEGYNMLTSDIDCVIVHTTDEATQKPIGISLEKEVANNAGSVLPSTGGIGTTIFYIIGGVLVAGALVLFVTKRRMASNG